MTTCFFLSGCASSIHSKKLPHILVKHSSFSLLTDSLSGCATIQSSPFILHSYQGKERERAVESGIRTACTLCVQTVRPFNPSFSLTLPAKTVLWSFGTPKKTSLGYTQLEHGSQNHKASSKTSTGFDWLTDWLDWTSWFLSKTKRKHLFICYFVKKKNFINKQEKTELKNIFLSLGTFLRNWVFEKTCSEILS